MTSRYGRPVELGLSIVPNAADASEAQKLAERADSLELDLLGIQDHPYQWRYLKTWMLMADLLARTERLRVFPDVANLPLSSFAHDFGFDTFIFWPSGDLLDQVERFAREVVPRLRAEP